MTGASNGMSKYPMGTRLREMLVAASEIRQGALSNATRAEKKMQEARRKREGDRVQGSFDCYPINSTLDVCPRTQFTPNMLYKGQSIRDARRMF